MAESASSRRKPVIVWCMFLATCAILVLLKLWQNHLFQTAPMKAATQQATYDNASAALQARVERIIGTPPIGRQALEEKLNGGVPLPTVERDVRDVGGATERLHIVNHRDPATGGEVVITFDADGNWRGLGRSQRRMRTTPPPRLWFEVEAVRIKAKSLGVWAWVAMLVWTGMTADPRRARQLAQCLLALSIVIFLAVATSPNPFPRRASDDQLLWMIFSCLMLGVSGFVLRHAITARARDDAFCETCGYDLRGNVSGICPECGTPAAPLAASRTDAG